MSLATIQEETPAPVSFSVVIAYHLAPSLNGGTKGKIPGLPRL